MGTVTLETLQDRGAFNSPVEWVHKRLSGNRAGVLNMGSVTDLHVFTQQTLLYL